MGQLSLWPPATLARLRGTEEPAPMKTDLLTPEHLANQQRVADRLAAHWRCDLVVFSKLSGVDYYTERDGRMVGLVEIKCRNQTTTEHDTVILAVRKWFVLMFASFGLNVPALFVVNFTDGLGWCHVSDVDATRHMIGGRANRGGRAARTDREPIIRVPVALFRFVPNTQQER